MDFKSICRICLEEKNGSITIFGASLAKMIMSCASIIIVEGDGLPHQICKQCTINAGRAYRFKELCEKSDNSLREYVNSLNVLNERLPIHTEPSTADLLLNDNNSLVNTCSVYSDLFMKNDTPLSEPLLIEENALSAALDINLQMQSISEQCLPSLWNFKKNSDFCTNSNDNLNDHSFVTALQSLDCDKTSSCINKDDWNLDLNNDIDSSTYIKSYIDLDHTSRIISEDQSQRQNETFTCQICGKIFMDETSFTNHDHLSLESLSDDILDKKYVCSFCGKRYKENKLLVLHLRSHTGSRPLKCEICNKTFALPSSLRKHRVIHTGEKKHKCPICDQAFFQSSNLNSHLRIHTGEKPFMCLICGKCFTIKRNLDAHSLLHSDIKPYRCMMCPASFTSASHLKRHETKHTGEKKYLCQHCGQAFRLKETRDCHVRSQHTGLRPYTCTVCPKRFLAANHLRTHMLSHTNERRHLCTMCNKTFMQKRHLTAHMNSHLGQRPYGCMVCGRMFSHSGSLSTHLKTHKKTILL